MITIEVFPEGFPPIVPPRWCVALLASQLLPTNAFLRQQQAASIPWTPRSLRFFFGKEDSSVAKMLLSEWVRSSELDGVSWASFWDGKSSSFCPFRFRRAGLMSGRRYRREPELEVTEPATDGAGEGMREGAQLPDSREKCSAMETARRENDEMIMPYNRHCFL